MSKVAVVYWTGTGNTEAMADAVVDGVIEAGGEAKLIFSDDFNASMMNDFDSIAFGCPAMGDEVLEEMSFDPMFTECEKDLKGRKIAIFGSYEWNNGEWMENWEKRCVDAEANLAYPPLPAYDAPNEEAIAKCRELGAAVV